MFACAVLIVVSGCGQKDGQPPGTVESTPAVAAQSAAPVPARDLSALNMCEVVKPDEVATAAGGKLAAEPSWNGSACMYVIEMPDDTESYLLSVYEAAAAEALLDYQSPEEKGDRIDGLWDEAWLGASAAGNGFSLTVLRRGDIALEATGNRRDVVLALGRLAVPRVQ
jgi:hypothetical protein